MSRNLRKFKFFHYFLDTLLYIHYITIMAILIIREIPDELHKDFKRLCFDLEISMNKKVKDLMEKAIREAETRHEKSN